MEHSHLENIYKKAQDKSDSDGELVIRLALQGWNSERIREYASATEDDQQEYMGTIDIFLTLWDKISKETTREPYELRFLELWDCAKKLVFGEIDPKMFSNTYMKQGYTLQEYAIITELSIGLAKLIHDRMKQ